MKLLNPKAGLWIMTALWTGVTAAMWAGNEYDLTHGREIRLEVLPVDPRDLFRGDYVVLNYPISSIKIADPQKAGPLFKNNSAVYVRLIEENGLYKAGQITQKPPKDAFFIGGKIQNSWSGQYRIRYGIENYFVPEGQGKAYEEARNRHQLQAVVNVSPCGLAKLKRLEIKPLPPSGETRPKAA